MKHEATLKMLLRICALMLLASPVLASDPTPLIEPFVEWPLLFFSVLLFIGAYFGLRNTLLLNLLFLGFQLLVFWWLTDADYMENLGGYLRVSMFINVVAVGFGIFKISKNSNKASSGGND